MANPEQVEILKKGVAEWNAWRVRSTVSPDLSGADLRRADLREAFRIGAILSGTNLTRANLSGADLSSANLRDADLRYANLSAAWLVNADLPNANLRAANLAGANLSDTDLRGAGLSEANLSEATLHETIFADVALTSVIGLETCFYTGASIIDHRALQKSGPLPLKFLRGVGLPDNLIEYLPSLLNQAPQYYSCFISHSSKDDEFAKLIHADLQESGVRCWFAPHDLRIGGKIFDEIDAAIRLRDKVLLILSEHSIKSDWVEDEVTGCFEEERERGQDVLFPIRLDDAVMRTSDAWAAELTQLSQLGEKKSAISTRA